MIRMETDLKRERGKYRKFRRIAEEENMICCEVGELRFLNQNTDPCKKR
jgi:hypothetical protein